MSMESVEINALAALYNAPSSDLEQLLASGESLLPHEEREEIVTPWIWDYNQLVRDSNDNETFAAILLEVTPDLAQLGDSNPMAASAAVAKLRAAYEDGLSTLLGL